MVDIDPKMDTIDGQNMVNQEIITVVDLVMVALHKGIMDKFHQGVIMVALLKGIIDKVHQGVIMMALLKGIMDKVHQGVNMVIEEMHHFKVDSIIENKLLQESFMTQMKSMKEIQKDSKISKTI